MRTFDNLAGVLKQLFRQIEDMGIEQMALRSLLRDHHGWSEQQLDKVQSDAKRNPSLRREATNMLSSWRRFIFDSAVDAVMKDLDE